MTLLQDGVSQATPFFERPTPDQAASDQLAMDGVRGALAAVLERLPAGPLEAETAQSLLSEATAAAGVKKGLLMKSLRAALLGSLQGPDLMTTWLLLHRIDEDRPRLEQALLG